MTQNQTRKELRGKVREMICERRHVRIARLGDGYELEAVKW